MNERNYLTGDEQLDDAIDRYFERLEASQPDVALVREMIVTALKLIKDRADRGDLKIINTTLKEMRYSFRVFAPYRRVRKCTIFGSARVGPETEEYRQAQEFAREMARLGYMIITGAGGGIMEAGNAGAGREMSFGVNIRLPHEQVPNPAIAGDPKLINFKYFFTRKLMFLKETHAVVFCPGGFGTHDEAFETLTLVQTGKSHLFPIVCLAPPGSTFWTDWERDIRQRLLGRGLISPDDLYLYKVTHSIDEACGEITGFY
ncbi:MAG TPA: LOG family protein, partial [Candidatus Nitrosotenuis sp.]|nr:LOG family protein [Candidatus Nitrosotenuis sp.]